MECRLTLVRIFVTNWERAIDFYTETLGIPLHARDDQLGWAELDTGAARLALERAADDPESRALVGRFTSVSLEVPNIALDPGEHEVFAATKPRFP